MGRCPHLWAINDGTPPQPVATGTQARIEFFDILYDHERHPKALLPIAAHLSSVRDFSAGVTRCENCGAVQAGQREGSDLTAGAAPSTQGGGHQRDEKEAHYHSAVRRKGRRFDSASALRS